MQQCLPFRWADSFQLVKAKRSGLGVARRGRRWDQTETRHWAIKLTVRKGGGSDQWLLETGNNGGTYGGTLGHLSSRQKASEEDDDENEVTVRVTGWLNRLANSSRRASRRVNTIEWPAPGKTGRTVIIRARATGEEADSGEAQLAIMRPRTPRTLSKVDWVTTLAHLIPRGNMWNGKDGRARLGEGRRRHRRNRHGLHPISLLR